MSAENKAPSNEKTALVDILSGALSIPGVKVNRESFLVQTFPKVEPAIREKILAEGPVRAGFTKEELHRIASNIIARYTWTSTGASFLTGLPGGVAGTTIGISADTMQYFGIALRLAQEISYLYGAEDLWNDNSINLDAVMNRFVLYFGVMLGAGGAAATMRVAFAALGKQVLKKLPQKALMKTFYYPIIKSIAKFFGKQMTKTTFAKGVSKVVPLIGGVVSGGITFATMPPMGNKLVEAFEILCFNYTDEKLEQDIETMKSTAVLEIEAEGEVSSDDDTETIPEDFQDNQ